MNSLINQTLNIRNPTFEDTDERCVNSVVNRIEEYTDMQPNKSPFSKNNNYVEYSEVQSNLHPHKCTLENNNFCYPSNQSVEDIDVHSSEKKRRSAANKSKVKILQEELKNSAIALQQSVQISYTLLNEVHRLDNATTDLQYDKERLTERNYYLFSENEYLKAKLKEYEEQNKYK